VLFCVHVIMSAESVCASTMTFSSFKMFANKPTHKNKS
jgi:hypothetical protein